MESMGEPRLLQTLRLQGEVRCADASGDWLAAGAGAALQSWHWAPGAGWASAGAAPLAHRFGVTAACWAPSGVLLASAGVDGVVRLWSRALTPRAALAAPGAAPVRALCWAGRRLLAGHDDGALCAWSPLGVLLARFVPHEAALHALAVPGDTLLLTGCTNGVLKVFDLVEVFRAGAEGGAPAPLTWLDDAHDLGVLCACTHLAGAATGGRDARVRTWRRGAAGLAPGCMLTGHGAAVTALRSAGALLASASLDRTARVWARGACLRVLHAHARYLTCVALADDLCYLITGSNDRSLRVWAPGALALDDALRPPCDAAAHFGLGDLEGIGPVEADESAVYEEGNELETDSDGEVEGAGGARRVWRAAPAHAGAVNCIAAHGHRLATASSDGLVKVWWWRGGRLEPVAALRAHAYPATAAAFCAGGARLLSAGRDARARLWDVQSGVQLRELSLPGAAADAGGGAVRAARVAPGRPPLLLLATDDGTASLWSLAENASAPLHVFECGGEALTCCAWAPGGRLAALGGAEGALRLVAPAPPATLLLEPCAHDLGVESSEFAPSSAGLALPEHSYMLATAGCDSVINLWIIQTALEDDNLMSATMRVVRQLPSDGGASCVSWGRVAGARGALLAGACADRWARVWHVGDAAKQLHLVCAVPVAGPGGAVAVALLGPGGEEGAAGREDGAAGGEGGAADGEGGAADGEGGAAGGEGGPSDSRPLLAAGSLRGELVLWRLPALVLGRDDEEGEPPALWGERGVARWLQEYVTRAPGGAAPREAEAEAALLRRAARAALTGARLLRAEPSDLLRDLGLGEEPGEAAPEQAAGSPPAATAPWHAATRARLLREIQWLRQGPPTAEQERAAPAALRCPLSLRLLREPARAADGFSYERANILDWFAAEGAVSPLSARRVRPRVRPNLALRARLQAYRAAPSLAPARP